MALADLPNPILVKELRGVMRGKRMLVAHFACLALFSLVLLIAIASLAGETDARIDPSLIGQGIFAIFVFFQAAVVLVVFPAFGATSIVGEKDRKTEELLTMSPMPAWRIVSGKFQASLLLGLVFLMSTLPLVSLSFLFGGVSVYAILIAYLVLFVTAVFVVAFALFFSANSRTNTRAVIATYIFSVLLFIALSIALEDVLDDLERFLMRGRASRYPFRGSVGFDWELIFFAIIVPAYAYLFSVSFFLLSAVNRLKPASANKSTAMRVHYLVGTGIGIAIWILGVETLYTVTPAPWQAYAGLISVVSVFMFLSGVFACEPVVLGARQRMGYAKLKGIERLLGVFLPGRRAGADFVLMTSVLFLAAIVVMYGSFHPISLKGGGNFILILTVVALSFVYTTFSCSVALLTSAIFRRSGVAKIVWGVVVVGLAVLPVFAYSFSRDDYRYENPGPAFSLADLSFLSWGIVHAVAISEWDWVASARKYDNTAVSIAGRPVSIFILFLVFYMLATMVVSVMARRIARRRMAEELSGDELQRQRARA
ncbi:MAG: ABC transporter permease subunit [Planctomycetota bacterium]|nr:ABC transporter permease subunit [Planctomycetota bacterium]